MLCRLQCVTNIGRATGWILDGVFRGRFDRLLGRLQNVTKIARATGWILDGMVRGRFDWLLGRLQNVTRIGRSMGWILNGVIRGRLDWLLGRLQRVTSIAGSATRLCCRLQCVTKITGTPGRLLRRLMGSQDTSRLLIENAFGQLLALLFWLPACANRDWCFCRYPRRLLCRLSCRVRSVSDAGVAPVWQLDLVVVQVAVAPRVPRVVWVLARWIDHAYLMRNCLLPCCNCQIGLNKIFFFKINITRVVVCQTG